MFSIELKMSSLLYLGIRIFSKSFSIFFLVAFIKSLASGIIIAHNHPSGNLNPSQPDINLTKKVKQAGNTMDVQVLDHLILTKDSYYSFADEGIM